MESKVVFKQKAGVFTGLQMFAEVLESPVSQIII